MLLDDKMVVMRVFDVVDGMVDGSDKMKVV